MKMFFAVFAAILAAAAVIGGVIAYGNKQKAKEAEIEKERATVLEVLSLSVKISEHFELSAIKEERMESLHDSLPKEINGLTELIKKNQMPKEDVQRYISDLGSRYRFYIRFIGRTYKNEKRWVEDADTALDGLESYLKT